MLNAYKLIIILPMVSMPKYIVNNKFAESISYSSLCIEKTKFKNTIEHNTMSMKELINENIEKTIYLIHETLK